MNDNLEHLYALIDKYTEIRKDGFAIHIEDEPVEWDHTIKVIGIREAYRKMAKYICDAYEKKFGEPYLLNEKCIAYEIEFHVDAFMTMQKLRGYSRHVGTLLYTKSQLLKHCGVIDISTKDLSVLKQRVMFRYRKGIRDIYKGTERDPFRR